MHVNRVVTNQEKSYLKLIILVWAVPCVF